MTVIGGFGEANDWDPANPHATLVDDGTGLWTAPISLASGSYLYLYRVTGDADGSPTAVRYALDPNVSGAVPCPAASPTYSTDVANPCSQLDLPGGAPPALKHVKGVIDYGGKPIAGYLVEIERQEPSQHHFFVNRTNSAADGSFDLLVAVGMYRIQVLHPTLLQETDVDRDPASLKALRRSISSAFDASNDVMLDAAEMKLATYASMVPNGVGALPQTFTIAISPGAKDARIALYGTKGGTGKNVGDPWFTSMYGPATSVDFDGTFSTKAALEPQVVKGEAYWWGTWEERSAGGKLTWSGQSMVLPITFQ